MSTELDVLSALADPTRWQLMDRIATRGGTTATVLATGLPVTRQAGVEHPGILERAGGDRPGAGPPHRLAVPAVGGQHAGG